MLENPGHGDCAWVEVSCGEGSDEGGKVGPAHREVSGEDLVEALVKLSLNGLDKGGRRVLLYHCLSSKAGFYFFHCYQERCKLKQCWVALLWPEQDRHHDKPLLQNLCCRLPANDKWDALLLNQRCRISVGCHCVGFQLCVPSSGDHGCFRAYGEGEVRELKDVDSVVRTVRIFSEEVDS